VFYIFSVACALIAAIWLARSGIMLGPLPQQFKLLMLLAILISAFLQVHGLDLLKWVTVLLLVVDFSQAIATANSTLQIGCTWVAIFVGDMVSFIAVLIFVEIIKYILTEKGSSSAFLVFVVGVVVLYVALFGVMDFFSKVC
jgi:hypothetical protein